MKRAFDIICSAAGLLILSPLFVLFALLVKLSSPGPAFFTQVRVGRGFRPFRLYKFRSMVTDAASGGSGGERGTEITVGGDVRITPVGRFLRKTKLDELPQLFNVLKGDMSLVGPRPEVEKYVNIFRKEFALVLKVRPGITDPASLAFSNEESLLNGREDPEEYYTRFVLPEKLRLAREYVKKASLQYDLKLILFTVLKVAYPAEQINRAMDAFKLFRRPVVVLIEVFVFALCSYAAFFIRFDGDIPPGDFAIFLKYLPLLIVIRTILLFAFKLDRGLWRYVSGKDILRISAAATLGTFIFLVAVRYVLGDVSYPRSVFVIDWFNNILFLSGIRLIKQFNDTVLVGEPACKKRIVVIGAGDAADMLIRDIEHSAHYPYRIVALVDDNPLKKHSRIRGVPVLGTRNDLEEIVASEEPDEFLIAIPSLSSSERERLVKRLREFALPIKTVPSLWGMLTGRDAISSIKVVAPEDVLFREPARAGGVELEGFFEGKRVMITGAGGSIGSELTLQMAGLDPEKLILFERHEESLYKMDLRLRGMSGEGKEGKERKKPLAHVSVIGDVTDKKRVLDVMKRYCPDIVFHAAAYKHVPLMEANPSEAFRTNVLGTRTVAEAASELGVDRFIFVSTDKAVNPVNVMGKTKKIAENIVRSFAGASANATRFVTVRFGNVLGSSGSVVPLFNEQIKRGGPVTVTHPEINRYFMTIPEAVRLVLQASAMGTGGEVFVLDMGEPVKILDLASRMISLYGYKPGIDIEITFTGLRPGEKLHEELFNAYERIEKTEHPKINRAVPEITAEMDLLLMLDSLDGDDLSMEGLLSGSYLDELATIEPESTHPAL